MEDNKDDMRIHKELVPELVVIKRSELLQLLKDVIEDGNIRDEEINRFTFPASEVFEAAFIDGVRYISSGIPIPDTVIKECYSIYEQTKL